MPRQDRATLTDRLAKLEAYMPEMIESTRPEDHLEAFAAYADEIRESAGPDDLAWVDHRLNCILHESGLIPGDDEPCDPA